MEVVRLKLIEAGSVLRKIWEPSLCFTSFLLFYPFLKMHNELHGSFSHGNLRNLGENFHKYVFVVRFSYLDIIL